MSVALFGGAFDPPHLGHVTLVQHALTHFGFDRLLVVPAGDPPHKEVATAADVRARLAHLAFDPIGRVELCPVELKPGGPRYTIETLRWARERYEDLTLLVGADEFADFLHWREPDEILRLAPVAVATRPGVSEHEFESVLAALPRPERIVFFTIPAYSVSSSEVRRRIHQGRPFDHLVPRAVAAEIERLGLYRD